MQVDKLYDTNHFVLRRIFPTQGLNPGLPHCRQDALPSEPPGKSYDTKIQQEQWENKKAWETQFEVVSHER